MSSDVRAFFDQWVRDKLPIRMSMTANPTPLSMISALRDDAAVAGWTDQDMDREMIDLFESMIQAMMNTPLVEGASPVGERDHRNRPPSPAAAMRLAISYLDGFRDVISDHPGLAADLVLCHLAKQGFRLIAWPDGPRPDGEDWSVVQPRLSLEGGA